MNTRDQLSQVRDALDELTGNATVEQYLRTEGATYDRLYRMGEELHDTLAEPWNDGTGYKLEKLKTNVIDALNEVQSAGVVDVKSMLETLWS
jgi:hypothetical protein